MFKKITLLSVLAGVCLLSTAQNSKVTPLNIGDTVPDIVFRNVVNYKDSVVRLSDFEGKLVVLDFWATSCMTCIYSMPYIDSLQSHFGEEIQFLFVNPLISGDDPARINRMMKLLKSKMDFDMALPMVLYDEEAIKCFPLKFLPQYVWIGPRRTVIAITKKATVTREAINKFLQNGIKPSSDIYFSTTQ